MNKGGVTKRENVGRFLKMSPERGRYIHRKLEGHGFVGNIRTASRQSDYVGVDFFFDCESDVLGVWTGKAIRIQDKFRETYVFKHIGDPRKDFFVHEGGGRKKVRVVRDILFELEKVSDDGVVSPGWAVDKKLEADYLFYSFRCGTYYIFPYKRILDWFRSELAKGSKITRHRGVCVIKGQETKNCFIGVDDLFDSLPVEISRQVYCGGDEELREKYLQDVGILCSEDEIRKAREFAIRAEKINRLYPPNR